MWPVFVESMCLSRVFCKSFSSGKAIGVKTPSLSGQSLSLWEVVGANTFLLFTRLPLEVGHWRLETGQDWMKRALEVERTPRKLEDECSDLVSNLHRNQFEHLCIKN